MKIKIFLIFFIFLFAFSSVNVIAQDSNVLFVEINGTIDQSTVEILKESLQRGETEESEAIVLMLNTPGGGWDQTKEIAEIINQSNIPVVGYVYPQGSTAWSAGTYILMSTHIAVMANYTIIGSCQPVEITVEGTKLINDSKRINALVAWIRTRAEMHGRNTTIAEKFVRENLDINATTAFSYDVIEFTASSKSQLLKKIDGYKITTARGKITLNTSGAKKLNYTPSIKIQFMKFISNPILTSLLFMLGIFALIFGISAPGYGSEVFGVIAILLSLIGSGFSVSAISIIFIIVGCLLLVVEIFVTPGFGIIGIGGVISLVIGGIFLIPTYSTREWVIDMSWINNLIVIVIAAGVLIAAFFLFLLYKIIKIRRKKAAVGVFEGEKAITIDRLTPDKPGYVRFKGEYWQAKSDEVIETNTKVVIVDKEGSTLIVKPWKKQTKH